MESIFYSSTCSSIDSDYSSMLLSSPTYEAPRSQDYDYDDPPAAGYLAPDSSFFNNDQIALSGYNDIVGSMGVPINTSTAAFYTYMPDSTIYHQDKDSFYQEKDTWLEYPRTMIPPTPEFEHLLSLTPPLTALPAPAPAPASASASASAQTDFCTPVTGLATPPEAFEDAKKPRKPKTESRMPLPELYARMGLGNDHDEARKREQRIFDILQREGFELGYKTWIRDTTEEERKNIIDNIFIETFDKYGYDRNLIEIIVRRGSYYLMQGRLRRIRRGSRRHQKERSYAVH